MVYNMGLKWGFVWLATKPLTESFEQFLRYLLDYSPARLESSATPFPTSGPRSSRLVAAIRWSASRSVVPITV